MVRGSSSPSCVTAMTTAESALDPFPSVRDPSRTHSVCLRRSDRGVHRAEVHLPRESGTVHERTWLPSGSTIPESSPDAGRAFHREVATHAERLDAVEAQPVALVVPARRRRRRRGNWRRSACSPGTSVAARDGSGDDRRESRPIGVSRQCTYGLTGGAAMLDVA